MSFTITLRQGAARLATTLPRATKCPSMPIRAFHGVPRHQFFTSKSPKITSAVGLRNSLSRAGTRTFSQFPNASAYQQTQSAQSPLRRLLVAGAIFGGTLTAINVVFNRETREGAIPEGERAYLNDAFLHLGLGVGTMALSARTMIRSGFVYRIMATNPWVFALGGLGASFATMFATRAIDPDNYIPKYAVWTAFNATQAAMFAPILLMYPPALAVRAGLYTAAMMGGLCVVGATAKEDKYLYIGGPLLAGACVIMASGVAPLLIPATAVRTLAFTENLWLYGGLALFGGFTLYDVQKIMHRARLAERGLIKRDPVGEAISLELDFLNIFIRMLQILGNRSNRK